MAEWLVEEGIGEDRAIQLDNGTITAARLQWPGLLATGQVEDATFVTRLPGSQRGIVRLSTGEEAFARRIPRETTEGMPLRVEITREVIAERGRLKRAQAVVTTKDTCPAPSLAESLISAGHETRIVRRFPQEVDWEELFEEAWSGEITFPGGSLLFADTPAMSLIDVDAQSADAVRQHAVPLIAQSLRRFDMGGNIGIDFPTVQDKADRKAVDELLGRELAGWPHERTAMNGFGFVQIVARLERPSILQRITRSRTGSAARLLLRRAEAVREPGALLLTCHPALEAKLKPAWLGELSRRTAREIRVETNPALALNGGFAQAVPL